MSAHISAVNKTPWERRPPQAPVVMVDRSSHVEKNRGNGRPRSASRLATMADVAALSGVSINTVSLAMRAPDRVAPATRSRISDAIDSLGYTPNRLAGALAANQTNIVAVIIPTIAYTSLSEIVNALTETFDKNGYEILIGMTNYSLENEARIVETFLSYRPAGMILTGLRHLSQVRARLSRFDFPIVEILNIGPQAIDMCVGFKHEKAMQTLAGLIIEGGRKKIAYVRTPHLETSDREADRLSAFLATMDAHGLPCHLIFESPSTMAGGITLMNKILNECPDADAIIFSSYSPAIGSLIFCQQNGIDVPGRFAIAAFGAPADVASAVHPGLTSIQIDHDAIGRTAASAILNRLAGEPETGSSVMDLHFELVRRGSA